MADSTSQTIFTLTGSLDRQASFPGGTTYQEFVGRLRAFEEVKGASRKGPTSFLTWLLRRREDAAGNKIDLNTYFGTPIGTIFRKDMKGLYPAAQAAYKLKKRTLPRIHSF